LRCVPNALRVSPTTPGEVTENPRALRRRGPPPIEVTRDVMASLVPQDKGKFIRVLGRSDQANGKNDQRAPVWGNGVKRVDPGARVALDKDLEITVQSRLALAAYLFGHWFNLIDHLNEIVHRHLGTACHLRLRQNVGANARRGETCRQEKRRKETKNEAHRCSDLFDA